MKNLQVFFSVQMASGVLPEIFSTFESAQKAAKKSDQAARAEVGEDLIEAWMLSNGISEHPAFSENQEKWSDCKGFSSIRWGALATARPVSA
jgi:hypothetical protein